MVVTKERNHKGETVPTSQPEGKKGSKDQQKKHGAKNQKEGKKGSKGKEDSKGANKDNQKKRGNKK
eukprot:scaffold1529_cov86-Cylindrotheca_fusiformis.AAC.11